MKNARTALLLPALLLAAVLAAQAPAETPGQRVLSLPTVSDLPLAPIDDDSHQRYPTGATHVHSALGESSAASICDKDIDPTGSIAGVSFVAAQDNGICTNTDIDVYENGGYWYIAQGGGTEAAFTITRIDPDGTLTLVTQYTWAQSPAYTADIATFKQGARRYLALALERGALGVSCGVVIVDVTDAPDITQEDIVAQQVGADWCDVHNAFVESDATGDGRYVYLTANLPHDMRVLDIGDLNNITEIGRYTHPEAGGSTYVHDVTVIDHGGSIGRRVYVSYWGAGLMILDASDVTPGVIESGSPNQPLNPSHSIDPNGFYVHHAYPSADGTRVFIQDEFLSLAGDEPVQMWNIESVGSPSYVDGIPLGSELLPLLNPAHNLLVEGNLLYVGWYKGGLQAFRFDADGFTGRPIYHQVQTEAADNKYDGAWGARLVTTGGKSYVAQSDRRYGLIVAGVQDRDGDGFNADIEAHVFSSAGDRDNDPCGTGGWPADLVDDILMPNGVVILDIADFVDPVRYFDTNVAAWPGGQQGAARRHDLHPGDPFGLGADINILDIVAVVATEAPMLGGNRAFDATCPFPP